MINILDGHGSQFFPDQNVIAKDLNMIGYVHNESTRSRLKAFTDEPGVVALDLEQDTSLKVVTSNGSTFEVFAGAAVDNEGRIINVPLNTGPVGNVGDDPRYRPALPDRYDLTANVGSAGEYYVNLIYTPMYANTRHDDAGNPYYTRVYDSYTISVDAFKIGITLARIHIDASGNIPQVNPGEQEGYYDPASGIRYAIYDERPTFKVKDGRIGTLKDLVEANAEDLSENLEKSVGFLYPQVGHAFSATIPRNVTITKFSVSCQGGDTGSITAHLKSGSIGNIESMGVLATVHADPGIWTSQLLDLAYTAGDTLRIEIGEAGASITECTASIVYNRRQVD